MVRSVGERVLLNLGWTGWFVLSVKVWAQLAAWSSPQMFFGF